MPYPYQIKLANSPIPQAINIPTGTGKTETAVLALWLWRKLNDESNTPKRLIYCLPRRVLVEQTKDRVDKWVQNLGLEKKVKTVLLMGGSDDEELDKYPSKYCIIIGTQDMLISGALNRAYGFSPYKWPVLFGLFNNDCMWVLDEIQVMENGLPTSIQLDAFRKYYKTYGNHMTLWMSATLNPKWLKTVNSQNHKVNIYELGKKDYDDALKKRNNAAKTLHKAAIIFKKKYNKKDVEYLLDLHKKGTVTAIMVNTVKRAQELYCLFRDQGIDCKLIHSRFRAADRRKLNEWIKTIKEEQDKIIISTQVLEAGVDISVRVLITEIAPWPNMVQRFGRCNRKGTMHKADVYWIDTDENLPYDKEETDHSRKILEEITGKSISPNKLPKIEEKRMFDSILRKKDLIDLFDTTSDLSGNYTDASRFVRDSKKSPDVGIFWRNGISEKADRDKESKPERDEICNVPIYEAQKLWTKKDMTAYVWDYAYGQWNKIRKDELVPGQTIMLDSKIGGYSETEGFDHTIKSDVYVIQGGTNEYESHDGENGRMHQKAYVTLEDHTSHVLYETSKIVKDLEFLDRDIKNTIMTSAGYHDVGKLHKTFQDTMNKGISDEKRVSGKFWAKSAGNHKHDRIGFRHEVASALAYLKQTKYLKSKSRDLASYLIMSHHGKVRLALRSVSRKKMTQGMLLGIKNGDELPQFSLPKSFKIKSVTGNKILESSMFGFDANEISIEKKIILNMSLAEMGRNESSDPSWVERTTTLLQLYGPFKLAYLESLIRAADGLASKKENEANVNE